MASKAFVRSRRQTNLSMRWSQTKPNSVEKQSLSYQRMFPRLRSSSGQGIPFFGQKTCIPYRGMTHRAVDDVARDLCDAGICFAAQAHIDRGCQVISTPPRMAIFCFCVSFYFVCPSDNSGAGFKSYHRPQKEKRNVSSTTNLMFLPYCCERVISC